MMRINKMTALLFIFAGVFIISCGKNDTQANTAQQTAPAASNEITLTDAEMEKASHIFFNTCAGCHGTLRGGATGPALLPDNRTKLLGTAALKAFITNGTPGGMPDWGKQGVLTPDEIDLMARFIQLPPPPVPEFSMADMKKNWIVHVAPEDRPDKPQHNRNWQNYMGVVLRDAGQVAIIDGDTKELVGIVNAGFAVHILRTSASGRYFYSIGRDGKLTLIDLWTEKPTLVAEAKASFDARSVEVSKYGKYADKYVIVGGYTPAHFVIFDAMTLEPLKVVATSGYTIDENVFKKEARVASIVASHSDPLWVVNVKETGMVWLVDYSDLDNLSVRMIKSELFLHDGGWDKTGQYFLVAANAKNKIVVIDVKNQKLETIIETGIKPHPGRGANVNNSRYGNLWVTGHLGENKISFIATDKNSKYRWTVVKNVELPGAGGGNLFVKTHPNSKHLWADRPLNPDTNLQRSIFAIDKETLEVVKTIQVPDEFPGRAVHLEYNKAGDEMWVSVWGKKDQATAVLVYDDKTFELKNVIKGDWVITPTGHFNVYNTMNDIY